MKQNVMDEVKMIFRPEFLNRIDEIIVFHALGEEHLKKIVSLMCREFTKRVKTQLDISLTLRILRKNGLRKKAKIQNTERVRLEEQCRQSWKISWQKQS